MTVFVYEHITATLPSDGSSLSREGLAMRDALIADLRAIKGLGVVAFPECVPPHLWETAFDRCLGDAEAVWLVAPETDLTLARLADRVVAAGRFLLGPSPSAIRLATDKLATAELWVAHGVPTPKTTPGPPHEFPVVVKPADGCGSTAVTLVRDAADWAVAVKRARGEQIDPRRLIIQRHCPGRAVSVAVLVGPNGTVPLVPTFQRVSPETHFAYGGGELPIPPALAERACDLALRAVRPVEGLLGYVGVDLVLGEAADGSEDVAIEINPRLTTSYVGLRALAAFNLSDVAIRCVNGETFPPLVWKPGRLRFSPDGDVAWL